MVTFQQVQAGITKYLDNEIVDQISGWQKWVVGAVSSIALTNSESIFDNLKSNKLIVMLGIIDVEDMVDIDVLHTEFKRQAKESGAITFNIPMIGTLTLNEGDVDKIYQYIKESR